VHVTTLNKTKVRWHLF